MTTPAATNDTVLGVVLLIRHGDREGFYQDPITYDASHTTITPLGNQQEIALGDLLRTRYLDASAGSPDHIQGMDAGLVNDTQVWIRADAGDEGGVIYASAVSLTQGLWPATAASNTTLANGTTVVGPLGGYQYVPIDAVNSAVDIELEGFTSCPNFDSSVTAFFNTPAFAQKANESAAFLKALTPYLDGRPVTLQNMWNIFDFMNVNSIHNATFNNTLPPTFLAQTRDLANWHEFNTFSDPSLSGIGTIAMRTVLPSVVSSLTRIVNASDPLQFTLEALSYKPFLSLFNMTGAATQNTSLAGIVEYTGAVALEVRQPAAGGAPNLRFLFKNGTEDEFRAYGILGGTGDVPLAQFLNTLAPPAVNTTAQWCTVCANNVSRGCGEIAAAAAQASAAVQSADARPHQRISPVGAGFLGAGLTLAVALAALVVLALFGFLAFGGRRPRRVPAKSDEMTTKEV